MPLMSGGDAVVRSILAHGVSTIYCLPGVQSDHLFNAMFDVGDALKVVHTRHEQGAAYMALGAALATGKPSVYSVVPGPGFLNSTAALATAAAQQATAAGHTLGQELALLTVHGVLHLLGYDHAEPDEEKEMFALQRQLLEEWVADQVEAYHQNRQSEKDRRLLDKSRYFDEP